MTASIIRAFQAALALATIATLAAICTLAAVQPGLAAEMTAMTGGQSITNQALARDGGRLLTVERDAQKCWTLRLSEDRGSQWSMIASAQSLPEDCRLTEAALSRDGEWVAHYDYIADRAVMLRPQGRELAIDGTIEIPGTKHFSNPPPPAVAMNGDGSLVLLGAPNYDCTFGIPRDRCGSAYLFERGAQGWQLTSTLAYPQPRLYGVFFGTAAALSADGGVAVTGGPGHVGDPGVAFVYERNEHGFHGFVTSLVPDEREESEFAKTLALDATGDLLAVGSNQSVYLFERTANGFENTQKLNAPERDAGGFGMIAALSDDGSTLLVGAPRSLCPPQPRCGRAYLYERGRGDRFELARTITAPTPVPYTDFAHALAIDRTGDTLALQAQRPFVVTLD